MSTKILIVDDSLESMESLKQDLQKNQSYKVIGLCQTPKDALDIINTETPDIIITDIILKGIDGLEFISQLQKLNIQSKIIVLSALSHDAFVLKALNLGVSYYMIKPCNANVLINRIEDILDNKSVNSTLPTSLDKKQLKLMEEKITNIFITVGIPAHIKGYQFLREAIKMAIENPEIINSITKKLYPAIADKFETSPSKVERAIRHAIEVAWNRGKIENINTLFGVKVYSNNEKPTNGEFIALVADKMLLEGV